MGFWDYFFFIAIILVLVGASLMLNRLEKKTKNKVKKEAYRLLDIPEPTRDEIIKNIKMIRLYGGRWFKDKEFKQLADRLIDKLEKTRKPDSSAPSIG
jgi:predicted membrane protein